MMMGKILLLKISRAKTELVQGSMTNMGCLGPGMAVLCWGNKSARLMRVERKKGHTVVSSGLSKAARFTG